MDDNLIKDNQTVEPEKLDLRSHDIAEDKRKELLRLFPEIRTEGGKIDIERLKLALGETVDVGKERYGMNWPGKADCFKTIQMPSLATLRPCPEESVNFDTTENLIIEGDNLEVLKLLQKSYLGKVKMIYIDPPYNTGNDFIYPDNYSESLQTYLEYTGQVDAEGRKFGTNTDTDGRFHSKWLNMMYPRLYLARNLLREDGMIFISIDDHEIDNLRKLCNEVFGEESFVANIIWQKKFAPQNDARYFSDNHDHILLFAKAKDMWARNLLPRTEKSNDRYENPDNDSRGPWASSDLLRMEHRDNGVYLIVSPTGKQWRPEQGTSWRHPEDEMKALIADNQVWFGSDGNSKPRRKRFLKHVRQGVVPETIWLHSECGHNQEGTQTFKALFEGSGIEYMNPKPPRLIRRMLELSTSKDSNDLVVDFFAGSGTTAHALLDLNRQDGGNRKFILVQLPEPTARTDYPTIADITKERVRRVIQKLNDEDLKKPQQQSLALPPSRTLPLKWGGSEGSGSSNRKNRSDEEQNPLKMEVPDIVPSPSQGESQDGGAGMEQANNPDRGFKVFKLAESNFKPWEAERPNDAESLARQLDLHIDHIRAGRTAEDLLYELLLKSGFPLSLKFEVFSFQRGQLELKTEPLKTEHSDGSKFPVFSVQQEGLKPESLKTEHSPVVYSVADGALFICLERELTLELIRAMAEKKPERVVCLDEGFAGNDQLKANAVQIFKTKGITSFKTV